MQQNIRNQDWSLFLFTNVSFIDWYKSIGHLMFADNPLFFVQNFHSFFRCQCKYL